MGKIYIVDIPKDFRVDLDSFAKMENVLSDIRGCLEPDGDGCGEFDGSDFFDDEGEYISRERKKAYNKGFISKCVSDQFNKVISEMREKSETIFEGVDHLDKHHNIYYPLSELFKKNNFVVLAAGKEDDEDGMIVQLSQKDKNNILKISKGWKHGIKK